MQFHQQATRKPSSGLNAPSRDALMCYAASITHDLHRLPRSAEAHGTWWRGVFGIELGRAPAAMILEDHEPPLLRCNMMRAAEIGRNFCSEQQFEHCARLTTQIVGEVLSDSAAFCKRTVDCTRFGRSLTERQQAQGILVMGGEYAPGNALGYAEMHAADWVSGYENAIRPVLDRPLSEQTLCCFEIANTFKLAMTGATSEYIQPACILNSQIKSILVGFNLRNENGAIVTANYVRLVSGKNAALQVYLTGIGRGRGSNEDKGLFELGEQIGEIKISESGKIAEVRSACFEKELTKNFRA